MNSLRKKLTGGVSPFSCKIYFINKAHSLELLWGTNPPMQINDSMFGIVTVGALGSYSIQIKDSAKFFRKFVGSNESYITIETIQKSFRSAFVGIIKSNIWKNVLV
ncbi:MAG TPA: SPFH domain-containing protein [Bacilli bacterium]|nr:SPFH domain-containing protein [Bacilli bacterium]